MKTRTTLRFECATAMSQSLSDAHALGVDPGFVPTLDSESEYERERCERVFEVVGKCDGDRAE